DEPGWIMWPGVLAARSRAPLSALEYGPRHPSPRSHTPVLRSPREAQSPTPRCPQVLPRFRIAGSGCAPCCTGQHPCSLPQRSVQTDHVVGTNHPSASQGSHAISNPSREVDLDVDPLTPLVQPSEGIVAIGKLCCTLLDVIRTELQRIAWPISQRSH